MAKTAKSRIFTEGTHAEKSVFPISEPSKAGLDRARIETYIGIALAIVLVVYPMTWWIRCLLLLVLCGIVCHLWFQHPATVSLSLVRKLLLSVLSVVAIGLISWRPIHNQYITEHTPPQHIPTADEIAADVAKRMSQNKPVSITDDISSRAHDEIAARPQPKSKVPLTSVLVMHANMVGGYGPDAPLTQVDLDISNPPEDDIQNMELAIGMESRKYVRNISEYSSGKDDCNLKAIDQLPEATVTFKGSAPGSHLTINSKGYTESSTKRLGSRQWSLVCPRILGHGSVRFQINVAGDAETDAIKVAGRYELIPSKGSTVVRVEKTIPVTK